MDFNLKQWRNESEQQDDEDPPSSKLPRLLLNSHSHQPSALPESNTHLSPFSFHHPTTTTKFPSTLSLSPSSSYMDDSSGSKRVGSYFSLSQWQELELQALIFRHMIEGADVPPHLLNLVKKSLINSPYHSLHHYFPHYQTSLLQSAYWGRAAMDPEPGRCRRTDGKKWRCSKEVVVGQKYCERHMHRGKNRSRKPVEITTSTTNGSSASGDQSITGGGSTHFTLSLPSHSTDLLHLNRTPPDANIDPMGPFEARKDGPPNGSSRILRHFFDDWPERIHESDNAAMLAASATDFSLKLGTGYRAETSTARVASSERERPQLNLEVVEGTNPMGSMGGPLAEALTSSASRSSKTSVLHRLSRVPPAFEASYMHSYS